jgi:hypothetical protein
MKKNLSCVAAPDGYALSLSFILQKTDRAYAIMDRKGTAVASTPHFIEKPCTVNVKKNRVVIGRYRKSLHRNGYRVFDERYTCAVFTCTHKLSASPKFGQLKLELTSKEFVNFKF